MIWLSRQVRLTRRCFQNCSQRKPFPSTPVSSTLTDGSLQVENVDTGAISTSDAAIPTTAVAFVITSDRSTGSYSIVDIASRDSFNDIDRGGIHSNAIARFFNGLIYVVNREGVDSIQIIDPQQGFTTPLERRIVGKQW